MAIRAAVSTDVLEVVRLAEVMFTSMGLESSDSWRGEAKRQFSGRLGRDLMVYVSDHPKVSDRLVAQAAGVIAHKSPIRRLAAPGRSRAAVMQQCL